MKFLDNKNKEEDAISLREVSKSFGPKYALKNVSVNFKKGRCTGIVGPGASGKTILVKIIAGLIKPDSGKVEIEGTDISRLNELHLQKVRSKIGMLFQNNALFDYLTVGENIAFPLRRLFQLSEEEISRRVAERLERVGLAGMEDRFPASLSGGQKKRVGIARCTVACQPYLIYDDPTAGLDPVTASKIFLLIREEQEKMGTTVIVISSDVDSLLKYIQNLIVLDRGVVMFEGAVEEAFKSSHPWVRAFLKGEWKKS